jgi:L-ascorbate metabolism protein UlaG (beta-lactamase superfamily)
VTLPHARITYIGGPTALIEVGGFRLLTDPTFDPAGSEYPTAVYTLRKTQGPALGVDDIGEIDAVLLSHDHHFDNLDVSGRAMLASARKVITTPAGAERLGGNAAGFEPWKSIELRAPDGERLRVTSAPARHGPAGGDRGPVTGFVLQSNGENEAAIYVTGDTVWYEGVADVARRFTIGAVLLFAGAARVRVAGPAHLTFDAHDAVELARAIPDAVIAPLHYEGWEHFSEGRAELERAFREAGLASRLRWLPRGEARELGRSGRD